MQTHPNTLPAWCFWLGIAGLSAAFDAAPGLQSAVLWFGICLLVGHSFLAAQSAIHCDENKAVLADQGQAERMCDHARSGHQCGMGFDLGS